MPRGKAPKTSPDSDGTLVELSAALLSRVCSFMDVQDICTLQGCCRDLLQSAASNEVWRSVCSRRRILLEDGAGETDVNWQQVFSCFALVWQYPRVRGAGWTFNSGVELNRAAAAMKRMGSDQRADSLAIVRRKLPAPAFWQWWLVAVIQGSRRGSGGTGRASGRAPAGAARASGVSGHTRGAVKAEKKKTRRVRITLKTGAGTTVTAPRNAVGEVSLASPPALSTRNSPRGMLRSPQRGGPPTLQLAVPKSPASMPPRCVTTVPLFPCS
jgi:hypothetical protein